MGFKEMMLRYYPGYYFSRLPNCHKIEIAIDLYMDFDFAIYIEIVIANLLQQLLIHSTCGNIRSKKS